MISLSETATAAPPLSRIPRRIRKSARAFGTRSPWAWVVVGMCLGKREGQTAIITEAGERVEKRVRTERERASAFGSCVLRSAPTMTAGCHGRAGGTRQSRRWHTLPPSVSATWLWRKIDGQ
jgi:hypothetical protein